MRGARAYFAGMEVRHLTGDLSRRLRSEQPDPERLQARLDLLAAQWHPAPIGEDVAPPPSDAQAPPSLPSSRARFPRIPRLDKRGWRALVMLLAAAAVVPAWAWWQGRPLPVTAIDESPTVAASSAAFAEASWAGATPSVVVVHVIGSVRKPGLVRLSAGARVDDAIAAAGGAKSAKALSSVNLARLVIDGEQIVVGNNQGAQSAGGPPGSTGSSGPLISVNAATAAQLEELPGVGPVLAQRIVDWRLSNGPFRSVDELGEVSGIGASILEQLRSKVTL